MAGPLRPWCVISKEPGGVKFEAEEGGNGRFESVAEVYRELAGFRGAATSGGQQEAITERIFASAQAEAEAAGGRTFSAENRSVGLESDAGFAGGVGETINDGLRTIG